GECGALSHQRGRRAEVSLRVRGGEHDAAAVEVLERHLRHRALEARGAALHLQQALHRQRADSDPLNEDLLARVALFAGLDRVDLAKLAAYLEPLEVPAGGEVFRQGDAADSLYIVAAGALAAYVAGRDEDQSVRVGTFATGDLFGEMALFTGEPRSATIRAERPSTILQLPRER